MSLYAGHDLGGGCRPQLEQLDLGTTLTVVAKRADIFLRVVCEACITSFSWPLSMMSLTKYPVCFDNSYLHKSSTGVDTMIISINLSFSSMFSNLQFIAFSRSLDTKSRFIKS